MSRKFYVPVEVNNQSVSEEAVAWYFPLLTGAQYLSKKIIKAYCPVLINGQSVSKLFYEAGGSSGLVVYDNGTWGYVPNGTSMSNYSTDFTNDVYTNKCLWWNGNAYTGYNGYVWEERTVSGDTFITKSGVHNDAYEMSFWYIPLKNSIYGDFTVRIEAKWREKSTRTPSNVNNAFEFGAYYVPDDWAATDEIGEDLPASNEDYATFSYTINAGDDPFSYVVLDAYCGAPQIRKIEIIGGRDYYKKATHAASAQLTNNIVQPLYLESDVLSAVTKKYTSDRRHTETDTYSVDSSSSDVYKVVLRMWDTNHTYQTYYPIFISESSFTLYQTHYRDDVYQYDATRTALAKTRYNKTYYVYGTGDFTNLNVITTNADLDRASECLIYFVSTDISMWEAAYITFDGTIS